MVRIPFRRKKLPAKRVAKPRPRPSEKPVEIATLQGEIKYPWGTVANATVKVGHRSAVTDRAGKFEIRAIDAGSYTISVEPPFPGYDAPPQKVIVDAGQTKTLYFFLDYAQTTVHGYVYGKDGKPIAGAILSGVMCGKDMKDTATDGTGYFKFDDARPGNLFIRVNAPGYLGETRDFAAKKGEKTKLEFHLTPGTCKISGIVSDEKDIPLSGEVLLSSESGIILQKTPSNAETGYYEFSAVPGTYNILANARGYSSGGWRGPILADNKVDVKLRPIPEIG